MLIARFNTEYYNKRFGKMGIAFILVVLGYLLTLRLIELLNDFSPTADVIFKLQSTYTVMDYGLLSVVSTLVFGTTILITATYLLEMFVGLFSGLFSKTKPYFHVTKHKIDIKVPLSSKEYIFTYDDIVSVTLNKRTKKEMLVTIKVSLNGKTRGRGLKTENFNFRLRGKDFDFLRSYLKQVCPEIDLNIKG